MPLAKGKTECGSVREQGGREMVECGLLKPLNEISFAAGTLSDDTLGVCLSVCGCIYVS